MHDDIRKKAEEKVDAKLGFYITAIVFTFAAFILITLSFYLPNAAIWLRLPIPVFMMVLSIMYLAIFGLPSSREFSDDWREDEVIREMINLYRKERGDLPPPDFYEDEEFFELKEIEKMERKERSS